MRPLRLMLSRFQSHRDTELDLSGISCAVLSGPNGAGKSSIIDGVRFALFGYARGGNLDTVVTEGEQVCRVEFEFGLGEDRYLVSRQRSKRGNGSTTLAFQRVTRPEAPEVLDGKSATETQARIIATLRMSDELFCQTACCNQGNASAFARAKPADRKAVLGEILDLGEWERRAKAAREMATGLEAQAGAQRSALDQAETLAAQAPGIEEALAAVGAELLHLEEVAAHLAGSLGEQESERTALVEARAADQARRRELTDLEARAVKLADARSVAEKRLQDAEQRAAGKALLLDDLRGAETAQAQAADMEAARQERERLLAEARPIAEQIKAAKAAHEAAVRQLETQIGAAKRERGHQVKARGEYLSRLGEQVEVLDAVPCANPRDEATRPSFLAIRDRCPLIAQAREAEAALPAARADLARLEAETPWADDERQLEELRGQDAATPLIARQNELKARYEAIVYDPAAHKRVREAAATIADLQRRLAQIEAAEGQVPALREALGRTETESGEIADRAAVLRKELGPQQDWAGEIGAVERTISEIKAEQARVGGQISEGQRAEAVLEERLRSAQEAAVRAEGLRSGIARLDRRSELLKILGNPRDGAFSKGGIPALLIDRAVPELEAAANEVLSVLSDERLALDLRTQRETQGKSLAETLDIVVLDERGPRLYETFSGGEAMRVDLALRIGLSTLMARRAGARCDLLVLDETAAPLDLRGQEQFVECVGRVAERFGLVLVVSHLDSLKDRFPCRLEITRTAEGSRVEVIA